MDLANTHKPFIWRKKFEELGIEIDERKIEEEFKRKAEKNRLELMKIKERQQRRELEFQQKQIDNEMIQRMKEAEQHQHWEQQEDDFLLRQRRQKSKIRIRDGRAKPLDLFVHYIDIFGVKLDETHKGNGYVQDEKIDLGDSAIELRNPCEWFNGLRLADLEELEPSIVDYMKADCEGNEPYWQDLLDITRNEAAKLRAAKNQATGSDIDPSVMDDIKAQFDGRSVEELDEMENEMLRDNDPTIDESLHTITLSLLRAHRARMRLTRVHKDNLNNEANPAKSQKAAHEDKKDHEELVQEEADDEPEKVEVEKEAVSEDEGDTSDYFKATRKSCIEEYIRGGYSPKMLTESQMESDVVLVSFEEQYQILEHQRRRVCNLSSSSEAKVATLTKEERAFMRAASKDMDAAKASSGCEATFGCEVQVRSADNRGQTYIWADKYQPRKPRYFNRVHIGFEWNKYNQTHYDIDNPPPKLVQGYKFNIFYPDLIDKSKMPKFTSTPCKDDREFSIIRITAGPPYEDIAFKIVNREWNKTRESGYKSEFENNMFKLWFQFKRYKYRR